MRTLSATALRAAFRQETDSVFLLMLTLSHPGLAAPIRVVNDLVPEDINRARVIMSRGHQFVCYPFQVDLPSDDGESISRVTLQIDNVDREIIRTLRATQGACAVTLEVVLAEHPDLVEAGPYNMSLISVDYDAVTILGELAYEDILGQKYPSDAYTPDDYPGLH